MVEAGPLAVAVAVLVVLASVFIVLRRWSMKTFLQKKRQQMQIIDARRISPDTKVFKLSLGDKRTILGLPVGKHITVYAPNPEQCLQSGEWNGKPDQDKGRAEISRTYTPITGSDTRGYAEFMIKCYQPGTVTMPDGKEIVWSDGGKMSRFLDAKIPGDFLEVLGPVGVHEYLGRGVFKAPGRTIKTDHICMMAGGVGITPILQIVKAVLQDTGDTCSMTLLYANKTYDDILARELLVEAEAASKGRFKIHYTLDAPPANWQGKTGFITADMIKEVFVGPDVAPAMVMCGPPPMIEFACKKNLEAVGYPKHTWLAL